MELFLLDVGIKKESIYKMEMFDKEKKDVDIIRKELNLPASKVLLYKDEDTFYGKENVKYFTTYNLDNLIKELSNFKDSIVVINLSKIKDYINEEWLEEGLTKDANVFSNFVFSKESIIILFNPNIVAPTVAGVIEVEIPYKVLGFTIE